MTDTEAPTDNTQDKTVATVPKSTQAKPVTNKDACSVSLAKKRKRYCRDVLGSIGKGPTLVVIPGGKFSMGGEKTSEQPVHDVTINPFALSVREISYGEFQQFCEDKQYQCPKQPWVGKDYPIVNVSWNDAMAYTTWLTGMTGNTYRLPSEAEWEYAARAGTKTLYPFGEEVLISDAVFSDRKKLASPLPKTDRSINRNKFRLYHMAGNVREWVTDTWHDGYDGTPNDGSPHNDSGVSMRVVRGGSYTDSANALRSGAREKLQTGTKDKFTGFRIVQVLAK